MGNSEYVLSNVSKIIIKKLDYEKEFIKAYQNKNKTNPYEDIDSELNSKWKYEFNEAFGATRLGQ